MPGRRLAFALVGILGTAAPLAAQSDIVARSAQRPMIPPSATPPVPTASEPVPPLLSIPETPGYLPSTAPCSTTPNAYYHGHAYLPETNPDGRTGLCGNDSRGNQLWFTAAYFLGVTEDLGPVKREETHGFRVGAGYWFDEYRSFGVELSFFSTHDSADTFTNIAFVNAPVVFAGGDLNLRANLFTFDRYRFDGLIGYRALYLSETYNSYSEVEPTILSHAENNVHAFQLGGVVHYHFGPYFTDATVKLGFGTNRQRLMLNGIETTDSKFAFVPEVTLRAGYLLGSGTRFYFGYNFVYLSQAARPNNLGPNNFSLNAFVLGMEFLF
jgi:hypothetical protein